MSWTESYLAKTGYAVEPSPPEEVGLWFKIDTLSAIQDKNALAEAVSQLIKENPSNENLPGELLTYLENSHRTPEEIQAILPLIKDLRQDYFFQARVHVLKEFAPERNDVDNIHDPQLALHYRLPEETSRTHEVFYRDSVWSTVSPSLGAIYSHDGLVQTFFQRDLKYESQEIPFSQKSFEVINMLGERLRKKALSPGDKSPDGLDYYLSVRQFLPEDLVQEFENQYNIRIPKHIEQIKSDETFSTLKKSDVQEAFVEMKQLRHLAIFDLNQRVSSLQKEMLAAQQPIQEVNIRQILQNAGADPEELEPLARQYATLINPVFRRKVEDDFGIHIENYAVHTQIQFLHMLAHKDVSDIEEIWQPFFEVAITEEEKQHRVKTFLAMEQNPQFEEVILLLDEKYSVENTDAIFGKYAEITDTLEELRVFVQKNYQGEESVSEATLQAIRKNLLRRANAILIKAERSPEEQFKKALQEITQSRENTVLFLSAFQELRRNDPNFHPEDLVDVRLVTSTGPQILAKAERLKQMKAIYESNYKEYPPAFTQALIRGFERRLQNPVTRVDILEKAAEDIGFTAFTPEEGGSLHFASFNVDPEFEGSGIGGAMMNQTLDREAQDHIIHAECLPFTAIGQAYLNNKGFVGVSTVNFHGELVLNIRRDDVANAHLESKQLSPEELVEEYSIPSRPDITLEKTSGTPNFSKLQDGSTVLSRLFYHQDGWYSVYEKV